jgi:hypothetical protein
MKRRLGELVGWYGVAALLLAYALVSFDVFESDSSPYQLLNLTGAAGVATISFVKRTYQPGVLNSIWSIIALIALIQIVL